MNENLTHICSLFSSNNDYSNSPNCFQILDGNGNPQIIPDINVYQQKKNLAQGMMDLALLSANANQLRYVVETYARHPYYWFSLISISVSLILQVSLEENINSITFQHLHHTYIEDGSKISIL